MWTEDSEAHVALHGITPDEVEDALTGPPRWIENVRDDLELVYGRTSAGRALLVVLTTGADGRDFVVTARDLTAREVKRLNTKGH